MKIALVIERMDTGRGGRETSTAQIAMGLARLGHDVSILCQRASWRGQGVQVRELGVRGLLRVQRLSNFLAAATEVVAREKFDIVHAMMPMKGANVYQPRGGTIPGQVAGSWRRWGVLGPLRVGLMEPLNLCRRLLGRLERELAADPSVLCLCVSEMVSEEFVRHYGRRENVRVVYNAVDVPDATPQQRQQWRNEMRAQLGAAESAPVFLVVAKNFALKGVAEAIRFFARWLNSPAGKPGALLVVVGQETADNYQRLAAGRSIGSSVRFMPPTENVFPLYSAADVCVLLSWYDPCSRVVLEAARWGLPSVTTVFNGAAEILAQGGGIVVSSPADARGVVAALTELADPERRIPRSRACLEAAEQLSMDRHVRELVEAYQTIRPR